MVLFDRVIGKIPLSATARNVNAASQQFKDFSALQQEFHKTPETH
jgi:hypothetical protein